VSIIFEARKIFAERWSCRINIFLKTLYRNENKKNCSYLVDSKAMIFIQVCKIEEECSLLQRMSRMPWINVRKQFRSVTFAVFILVYKAFEFFSALVHRFRNHILAPLVIKIVGGHFRELLHGQVLVAVFVELSQ